MVTPEPATQQSVAIPAATFEDQSWTPNERGYYSRAEMRRQRGTYQSFSTCTPCRS